MAKFSPPGEFDFVPENWQSWSARWAMFYSISKLDKEDAAVQINSLLYSMGPASNSIFNSLGLSASDAKDYKKVLVAFNKYFAPKKYIIFERAKFFRRDQLVGETVEQYVRALNEIVHKCEFGDKRSEQMRDRIVVGILDKQTSREMQKMDIDELTEETAIAMARQAEQVDRNIKELSSSAAKSSEACATDCVSEIQKQTVDQVKAKKPQDNCSRCGYSVHTKGTCPAIGSTCRKCNGRNHFSKVCRSSRRVNHVNEMTTQLPSKVDSLFIDTVASRDSEGVWSKLVRVDGISEPVEFKLDTGADVSVIPSSLCKNIKLRAPIKKLKGPGDQCIPVLGCFHSKLTVNDTVHSENLYVVEQNRALLSRNACVKLGLVSRCGEIDSIAQSDSKFMKEFPALFDGLGRMKQEAKVVLEPGCKPYAIYTPRSVPYPLMDRVKKELENMVSNEVIFPVSKPTDWCSPMVVVPKANNAVRICVDYTQLNKVVKREVYPMAHVESSLAKLSGGTIFTKLDANSGFYQIPLAEEAQLLTTFLSPFGRFAYRRLPFGLSSSPEIYSKIISETLCGLEGVVVHMDDVCVWGSNLNEHDTRVRAVLEKMQQAGMTLNTSKCEFSRSSIKFLGHVISAQGIQASPEAVQGLLGFATPQNVSEFEASWAWLTS